STYSTHYPFSLPSDAGERPLPAGAGLKAEYRQVLSYTDRHVGRLMSFLATHARHDRTITIVVGDHGFYTDLRRTSGLPENDNVWTAAIISGPEDFLGPPRRARSEEHTSELQSRFDLVCRLLLEKKKNRLLVQHRTCAAVIC